MTTKKTPDPDEPELGEIEIEQRYTNRGRGPSKVYLVVSFDALAAILYCENSVIAPHDVPALLNALAGYAETAGHSDPHDIAAWEVHANMLTVDEEDDDDGEEEAKET